MEVRFKEPLADIRRRGVAARRSLSQNFLSDAVVAAAVFDALPQSPRNIVEVGAGPGTMTRGLAATRDAVAAVEVDERMVVSLRRQLAGLENVSIVAGDARIVDLAHLVAAPYAVFGNIPYHITGLLVPRLVRLDPAPEWVSVMVQLEVGERICADPGGWSLATLAVRTAANAEILMRVPARAFEPQPKVDSALVMLWPTAPATFADDAFFTFARAVFQERRKKLPNAVANALGHDVARAREVVARSGLDEMRRPQTLDLAEWERLYRAFTGAA